MLPSTLVPVWSFPMLTLGLAMWFALASGTLARGKQVFDKHWPGKSREVLSGWPVAETQLQMKVKDFYLPNGPCQLWLLPEGMPRVAPPNEFWWSGTCWQRPCAVPCRLGKKSSCWWDQQKKGASQWCCSSLARISCSQKHTGDHHLILWPTYKSWIPLHV